MLSIRFSRNNQNTIATTINYIKYSVQIGLAHFINYSKSIKLFEYSEIDFNPNQKMQYFFYFFLLSIFSFNNTDKKPFKHYNKN